MRVYLSVLLARVAKRNFLNNGLRQGLGAFVLLCTLPNTLSAAISTLR